MLLRPLVASLAALLAAGEPSLRLDHGGPVPIVDPGAERQAALVLANPGPGALSVRLIATVTGFDGGRERLERDCTVPAGGEERLPVPLGDGRLGIRWVEAGAAGPGLALQARGAFVLAPPAGPGRDATGFVWGVCSHPEHATAPEREREMQAAAAVGVGLLRGGPEWHQLEREAGRWDWSLLDDVLERAGRHGIELQILLAYGTRHGADAAGRAAFALAQARKDPNAWQAWSRAAQEDGAWRRYVAAVAARCRGQVRFYEVWNEPDLGFFRGTTDDYIRMLRSAQAEIRAADPQALVMSGGFATVNPHPSRAFNPDLQARVLAEASDAFDIHAYHGHESFDGFQQSVDGDLARLRAAMPHPRPLFFNETGVHSTFGSERRQALQLVKKIAFARARGAIGYSWYDLRNDGVDPANAEHNYGLITRDFQAKPAYAAWNELVRRLRGLRDAGPLALGPGRFAYASVGGGRRVAVLWNEDPGLADAPVVLLAPGCAGGTRYDLMGNPSPLPAVDGAVVVQPGAEPAYAELPGGEEPLRVAGDLLALEGPVLAVAGEALTLPVRLANPLARPIAIRLSWPGGEERVALAPGSGRTLAVPAIGPAGTDGRAAIPLRYAVEDAPWSGAVAVPVQLAHRVGAGDPAGRGPDFTADQAASVINFCQTDPALQDCNWRGADDCSFRLWLARGDGALRLRVEVRDDVHVQAEDAAGAWAGDGIQFAFQIPGSAKRWELGVARRRDGALLRSRWSRPDGATADADAMQAAATPVAGGMLYEVALPYAAFGLTDALLERGLRFNLLVNDNDGALREGFVRLAPGLGERKDATLWPLVRFPSSARVVGP